MFISSIRVCASLLSFVSGSSLMYSVKSTVVVAAVIFTQSLEPK